MVGIDLINPKDSAVASQVHALFVQAQAQESKVLAMPGTATAAGTRTVEQIERSHELYLGAIKSAQLIGVLSFGPDDEPGQIAIATLVVHPAHQRQGVASALVAAALQRARGYTLCVTAGLRNTSAIKLYERLGFVPYRRGLLGQEDIEFVKLRAHAH